MRFIEDTIRSVQQPSQIVSWFRLDNVFSTAIACGKRAGLRSSHETVVLPE